MTYVRLLLVTLPADGPMRRFVGIYTDINYRNVFFVNTYRTRGSAIAEEPRDALRQLKYYGRFLTELLTRSSANPEEPCEHTVS